jgi:MSHA pilin protein MshD
MKRLRQRGLTMIELIMFIVIVSIGLAGILVVLDQSTSRSADPMIRKQMLAIAESVLEEVRLQPFTWCDPDDVNAATAASAADCTGGTGGVNDQLRLPLGPTAGETRGSPTTPFDNVADYNGAAITTNITGTAMPAGYSAGVQVLQEALGSIASTDALRIRVTVTHGTESIVLDGYRTRYAPNSLP